VAPQVADKDFYSVLKVPSTATPVQIKDAYRALAKKHHPDVQSGDQGSHDPDVDKFRSVVEAYQVLSVKESRAAFDLTRKKNPHLYTATPMSDEQYDMNYRRDLRNKQGLSPRTPAARGSYAEQRIAELKAERAKYNVNDLGYYNGGVPRANRGTIRGKAMGEVGSFHSPQIHNFLNFNHADSQRVSPEDAVKFKHFMGTDKADFQRTKPGYPMFYDKDFNFRKDRDFWFKLILGMATMSYVCKKWQVEVDRSRMTARMNGYKGLPGHHFNNRGGVVVLKDFVGFEKYYKTGDDMNAWYKKVYPNQFH